MQVAVTSQIVTMSSREIAELVDARHNDVVATIDRLFSKGVLRGSRKTLRDYLPEGGGRPTKVYDLDKRDTLVVASGYSDEMRARIIDRWQELEAAVAVVAAPALPDFTNAVIAARAWADQFEQRLVLEAQIALNAPKTDFYDKYTKAEGNKGIREVAKLLHANERDFVTFLRTNNIVYRLNGRLAPYAHQQQALRMDVKAGVGANDHAFNQPVFTPKGVTWIAAEWAKYQAIEV